MRHRDVESSAPVVDATAREREIEEDEHLWDAQFAASQDLLAFLAQEALDDDATGRTEPLEFDML